MDGFLKISIKTSQAPKEEFILALHRCPAQNLDRKKNRLYILKLHSFLKMQFLECALSGMCCFWNMLFLECALFGMCPFSFQNCQPAQNQPKSQFQFHKNCSPRDLCIMTLFSTALCKSPSLVWCIPLPRVI